MLILPHGENLLPYKSRESFLLSIDAISAKCSSIRLKILLFGPTFFSSSSLFVSSSNFLLHPIMSFTIWWWALATAMKASLFVAGVTIDWCHFIHPPTQLYNMHFITLSHFTVKLLMRIFANTPSLFPTQKIICIWTWIREKIHRNVGSICKLIFTCIICQWEWKF